MNILGLRREPIMSDEDHDQVIRSERPLSPEVMQHIEGIERLHDELEQTRAQAEAYRRGVEQSLNEIRGLKTELEAVKRMFNTEEKLRRHYEKLAQSLGVSLRNTKTMLDSVFAEAAAQMAIADATRNEQENAQRSEGLEQENTKDEVEHEVPKFIKKGPRSEKEVQDHA